jgi:hypothetical protein
MGFEFLRAGQVKARGRQRVFFVGSLRVEVIGGHFLYSVADTRFVIS